MQYILPKAACLTTASPLIGEYTLNLIKDYQHHQVIINSFPQKEFLKPENKTIQIGTARAINPI